MLLSPKETLLNRFEVERLLGEGGMAEIYLAFDKQREAKTALKVGSRDKERLKREFSLLKGLSHEGVISVDEFFSVDNFHLFSMEFLESGTLNDRIAASGKLPFEQALGVTKGILQTLTYLHSQGIVHQDLKPENILFREESTPVLIDFGIAREVDEAGATISTAGEGTFDYKSPEQLRGDPTDARSDIFSLGVVMYEILSGSPPFHSEAISEHLDQRLEGPKPLSRKDRSVPSWADEFISICTWNDVEGRFQTTKEAIGYLNEMESKSQGVFSTLARLFT